MNRCRDFFAGLLRKYPCCGAFCAIAVTTIPFLLRPGMPFPLLMIPASIFLILAGFFVSGRDGLFRLALPALAASVSVFLHQRMYLGDPLMDAFSGGPGRADAVIRIEDTSASPGFFVPDRGKKSLRARVLRLVTPGGERNHLSAPLMVYLPEDAAYEAGYGDTLEVSGLFLRPGGALAPDSFDYRGYLARQMIFYTLRAEQVRVLDRGSGGVRFLLDLRDAVLDRVCTPLPEDVRYLGAGILFGVRTGLPADRRRDFLSSGMIHILSVSGTHVMMFASLMLLLLAPLPLRTRTVLVLFMTLLYTVSTGMQGPAARAFLMFALFLGLRAFLLRSAPLNTLALAACLLTLYDPFVPASPGFQFSFLTVAALFFSGAAVRYWFFLPTERFLLTPNRWMTSGRARKEVWKKRLISLTAACTAAWLISLPLSLLYQGIWPGGSIFANLLASPLIALAFPLFFCAACFSFVPGVSSFFISLFGSCLKGITACAALFSGFSSVIPGIPAWCAVLFLLLIFLLLGARTIRRAVLLTGLCVLFAVTLFLRKFYLPEQVLLLTDGRSFSLGVAFPSISSAAVVGMPDKTAAREMASCLTSQGIERCHVLFHGADRNSKAAAVSFSGRIRVDRSLAGRSGKGLRAGIRETSDPGGSVLAWREHTQFTIREPGGRILLSGQAEPMEGGGLRITLRDERSGEERLRREFYPCSRYCLEKVPLPR